MIVFIYQYILNNKRLCKNYMILCISSKSSSLKG
jgi:hypothetical protein